MFHHGIACCLLDDIDILYAGILCCGMITIVWVLFVRQADGLPQRLGGIY
jgi:hypothetical protein